MRILVDTTYLLPLAGIAVEGVEKDLLRRALATAHEICASDISFFEILAKGAKLSAEGMADEERVVLSIQSLVEDRRITKVSAYQEEAMRSALSLRRQHRDFVDCLILASALENCDALATEDGTLGGNEGVLKFVKARRPKFRVSSLEDLLKT